MEFLVGFGIVLFILYLIGKSSSTTSQSTSSSSPTTTYNDYGGYRLSNVFGTLKKETGLATFEFDLVLTRLELKDHSFIPGVDVFIQGNITGLPNRSLKILLFLKDEGAVNNDFTGSVLTQLDFLSYKDTGRFCLEMGPLKIPYLQTSLSRVKAGSFPLEPLEFPRGGEVILTATLISQLSDSEPVGISTRKFNFKTPKEGFLEKIKRREKSYHTVIEIACLASASDGHMSRTEVSIIKKWIKDNHGDDETLKNELLELVDETKKRIEVGTTPSLDALLTKFDKEAETSAKYEAIELLVKIVGSDGSVDTKERELIDTYVKKMNLETNKFRELFNKHMPTTALVNSSVHTDLGIQPDMTVDQKKEQLKKQYLVWSNKVTSSKPDIRDKANEMLKVIAEERAKLNNPS